MERSPLADSEIYPNNGLIKKYLQEAYPIYEEFSSYVNDEQNGLNPIWQYYNDTKYWLCKVQHKKKTIFWLSIWEGSFKLTFYFAEKYEAAIEDLEIDQSIKKQYKSNRRIGKIKAITLEITMRKQLQNAYTLIEYKKSLK